MYSFLSLHLLLVFHTIYFDHMISIPPTPPFFIHRTHVLYLSYKQNNGKTTATTLNLVVQFVLAIVPGYQVNSTKLKYIN